MNLTAPESVGYNRSCRETLGPSAKFFRRVGGGNMKARVNFERDGWVLYYEHEGAKGVYELEERFFNYGKKARREAAAWLHSRLGVCVDVEHIEVTGLLPGKEPERAVPRPKRLTLAEVLRREREEKHNG